MVFKEPTAIASTDVNEGKRIFTHIQSEVYPCVMSDDEAINIHRTMNGIKYVESLIINSLLW